MPDLKIKVTGKSSINHAPELCTLKFSLKTSGATRESVAGEMTPAANDLQIWFKQFHMPEAATTDQPVTRFSTSNMKTWVREKDNNDNPVAEPHHASITFTAVFREFAALGNVVGELLSNSKVEIDSINWSLTEETGKRLSSQTRKLALRDAIQQADDLSEVLGREVVAVEIADSGYHSGPQVRYMMAADLGGGYRDPPKLDFTPQEIDVETSLEVRFEAL